MKNGTKSIDFENELRKKGKYSMVWMNIRKTEPDNEEYVIVHCFGWKEWYFETAIFHKNTKLFQSGYGRGFIEMNCVDYWMRVPTLKYDD